MFVLSVFKDGVRVDPGCFDKDQTDVIRAVLISKYANKVVRNVGLCITVFDIMEKADTYIFPNDGAAHIEVTFRVVVFRPFIGEVLMGKIKSSNEEGVHVTMSFFDDIHIPANAMQPGTNFVQAEQAWCWNYEGAELFMDVGDKIRFRVTRELFTDPWQTGGSAPRQGEESQPANEAPYKIFGTVNDFGLGITSWWD
eukprot:m.128318 g.128318  ORF g.128318 m.128318 type:complete len:197 (-) comp14559_c0_seq17:220-810(-)